MNKLNIAFATIGCLPQSIRFNKLTTWKSNLFSISKNIDSYQLPRDADGPGWVYSDESLGNVLPDNHAEELLIAIVNVPLELNWYVRRLDNNVIVLTLHQINDFLQKNNIPTENIILRVLYAYSLVFLRNHERVPTSNEFTDFVHDDTRGCLFDMNGIKTDVIYSCDKPIICDSCVERMRNERVSDRIIYLCQKEIKKIKKTLFQRISDFIKRHPIWSIILSTTFALTVGTIASATGNILYNYFLSLLVP